MKLGATALERFKGWFVEPIEQLKRLPEGDGAFAALMIALPLYERYIVARLKADGKPQGDEEKREEMAKDLELSDRQRSVFYDVFRNGFMHAAMGRLGKTRWAVSAEYDAIPSFKEVGGVDYILIDPWKFAERVLQKFIDEPCLIDSSESFPLADVFDLPASGSVE